MGQVEIKVVESELQGAISSLTNLLSGSGYSRTSKIVSRGYGKTADALNQMCAELSLVEEELLTLIQLTIGALQSASVQFAGADAQAAQDIASIEGSRSGA